MDDRAADAFSPGKRHDFSTNRHGLIIHRIRESCIIALKDCDRQLPGGVKGESYRELPEVYLDLLVGWELQCRALRHIGCSSVTRNEPADLPWIRAGGSGASWPSASIGPASRSASLSSARELMPSVLAGRRSAARDRRPVAPLHTSARVRACPTGRD